MRRWFERSDREELAHPRFFERIAGALSISFERARHAARRTAQIGPQAQRVALHRPGPSPQVVDQRGAVGRWSRGDRRPRRPDSAKSLVSCRSLKRWLKLSSISSSARPQVRKRSLLRTSSIRCGCSWASSSSRRAGASLRSISIALLALPQVLEQGMRRPVPAGRRLRTRSPSAKTRLRPNGAKGPVISRQVAQSVRRWARIDRPSPADTSPVMNRSSDARSGWNSPQLLLFTGALFHEPGRHQAAGETRPGTARRSCRRRTAGSRGQPRLPGDCSPGRSEASATAGSAAGWRRARGRDRAARRPVRSDRDAPARKRVEDRAVDQGQQALLPRRQ